MAYAFTVGRGTDEDVSIVIDIGAGSSNPRIIYDSSSGTINLSNGGTTYETTWENPERWGELRMWPDATNHVPRWKWGANPSSEIDGAEFGQFTEFVR